MSSRNKLREKRIRQLPAISQEEAGWIRCMGQREVPILTPPFGMMLIDRKNHLVRR